MVSLALSWGVVGCGDDSKAIQEQWPNWTAGSLAPSTSAKSSSTPVQTSDPGANTSADTSAKSTSASPGSSTVSTGNTRSATGTGTLVPTACTPDRYRCVAPLPAGWSGPIARKAKNAQGLVPRCDDEYRFEVNALPYHAEPQFQAATCSPCSCGTPTGATCSKVSNVKFYKEAKCVATDELTSVPTVDSSGACTAVTGTVGTARSVKVPNPVLDTTQVKCPANGGFATKTGFTWAQQERLCRSRGSENLKCADASQICVPKVASSFTQGVCIYRDGDHACPAQGYTKKSLRYKNAKDTRGCEACTCGPFTGALSCKGHFRMFSNPECVADGGGPVQSLRLDLTKSESCGDVSNFIYPAGIPQGVALELEIGGIKQASCAPGGGMAKGVVQGTDPVTLCCTAD